MTDTGVTPYEVASLATRIPKEQIDDAVQAIPYDKVVLYLYQVDAARTLVNALGKAVTARMVVEGRLGETWTAPDGEPYRFECERRSKWTDVAGMFFVLGAKGVSLSDLGSAVSDIRVTDLREAAERLPDDERADALAIIEDHRQWTDGTPKLTPVENKWKKRK